MVMLAARNNVLSWKQCTGTVWCQKMMYQMQMNQPVLSMFTDWIKGVDTISTSDYEEVHWPYNIRDHIWVKSPNSQCTTSSRNGCVMGEISKYSVLVDGTPYHIKDLHFDFRLTSLMNNSSIHESSNNVVLLQCKSYLLNNLFDDLSTPPIMSDESSEEDTYIIPVQRSKRQRGSRIEIHLPTTKNMTKTPTPSFYLCDKEIRMQRAIEINLSSKRLRSCTCQCPWLHKANKN